MAASAWFQTSRGQQNTLFAEAKVPVTGIARLNLCEECPQRYLSTYKDNGPAVKAEPHDKAIFFATDLSGWSAVLYCPEFLFPVQQNKPNIQPHGQ